MLRYALLSLDLIVNAPAPTAARGVRRPMFGNGLRQNVAGTLSWRLDASAASTTTVRIRVSASDTHQSTLVPRLDCVLFHLDIAAGRESHSPSLPMPIDPAALLITGS